MQTDSSRAKLIFSRWKADLIDKPKTMEHLSDNFGELFFELSKNEVSFDEAHDIIKDAVAAHLPSAVIAQAVWKKQKNLYEGSNFHDWFAHWKDAIKDRCTQSFFCFYQMEETQVEEEKKFGSMSIQEYTIQRRHADSFPILDTDKLKLEMAAIREAIRKAAEDEDDGK